MDDGMNAMNEEHIHNAARVFTYARVSTINCVVHRLIEQTSVEPSLQLSILRIRTDELSNLLLSIQWS